MPFDGADFPQRCDPPRRAPSNDNAVTVMIVLIAFGLLVMPISLSGFIDIVRYVRSP